MHDLKKKKYKNPFYVQDGILWENEQDIYFYEHLLLGLNLYWLTISQKERPTSFIISLAKGKYLHQCKSYNETFKID